MVEEAGGGSVRISSPSIRTTSVVQLKRLRGNTKRCSSIISRESHSTPRAIAAPGMNRHGLGPKENDTAT